MRDTKHNATVTTLLDMFMTLNPEKGRTQEEKDEVKGKYVVGENVLVKPEQKELTLRERRVVDDDRRLMERVREESLREVGVSGENDGERRRRLDTRRGTRSRDTSRDGTRPVTSDDRERERERRRRREAQSGGSTLQPETGSTQERRRRRSNEERSTRDRRHEETSRTAARQIEHQSSLRSLISNTDVDSREMEEEILRQIREEGLLDGIDLENIDVNQEDQISERIAEAFRRRQEEREAPRSNRPEPNERARTDPTRPSTSSGRRRGLSNPDSREISGDDRPRTASRQRRTHSRSTSAVSSNDVSRPPQSMSAAQASHLEVQSSDEGRHRRRRSSSRSNSTPVSAANVQTTPAARSQTDLSNMPSSLHLPTSSRPSISESTRSSTEPSAQQTTTQPSSELSVPERGPRQLRASPNSSPRSRSTTRMEDSTLPPGAERPRRAAPPADILITPTTAAQNLVDRTLVTQPFSPSRVSLSDRANAISSGTRPTSSSSTASRNRPHQQLYPEPSLTCAKCSRPHIEYELHYNCGICLNGSYNICLSCYRHGYGCLHWFGFGQAAWDKWEIQSQSSDKPLEQPHILTPSRYLPPKVIPGGADGRRTLTTEDPQRRLQSGTFCDSCFAWTNECYWRCDLCNEGVWGFCNTCVNQGKSCDHLLLPLTYKPVDTNNPPISPTYFQETPVSASILTGPGVMDLGRFKPLTFSKQCAICENRIPPSQTRYHCFECTSKVPGTLPGDYDICTACYPKLVPWRRISVENGHSGWRRCLQGHRMVIISFEDHHGGQRRKVDQDLVGGRGIHELPHNSSEHPDGLVVWSWGDGKHINGNDTHRRLVTTDVTKTAPTNVSGVVQDTIFPPDGGVGMKTVAIWSRWPEDGADDELAFPKRGIVSECKDVNGDWFHGVYMGRSGWFPSNHVKVLDRGL